MLILSCIVSARCMPLQPVVLFRTSNKKTGVCKVKIKRPLPTTYTPPQYNLHPNTKENFCFTHKKKTPASARASKLYSIKTNYDVFFLRKLLSVSVTCGGSAIPNRSSVGRTSDTIKIP